MTPVDTRIAEELAKGLTKHEIAATTGWSYRTVRRAIARLQQEAGTGNLFQLGIWWQQQSQNGHEKRAA